MTSPSGFSAPFAADLNGDGYIDFLVGGGDGKVALLSNNRDGTFTVAAADVFGQAIKKYAKSSAGGSLFRKTKGFGGLDRAASAAALLPLALSGFASVGVGAVLAMGPTYVVATKKDALKSLGTSAHPFCADVDYDGDLDCAVGFGDGTVAYFKNVLDPSQVAAAKEAASAAGEAYAGTWPQFELQYSDVLGTAKAQPDATDAAPFLLDFDGDGDVDVMVGFADGTVAYYMNVNPAPVRDEESGSYAYSPWTPKSFALMSGDVFASVGVEGHASAALWCGSLDADSVTECLLGSATRSFAYDSALPVPTHAPTSTPSPSTMPSPFPFPHPTPKPTMHPTTLYFKDNGHNEGQAPGNDHDGRGGVGVASSSMTLLLCVVVGSAALCAVFAGVAAWRHRKASADKAMAQRFGGEAERDGHDAEGGNVELGEGGGKDGGEGRARMASEREEGVSLSDFSPPESGEGPGDVPSVRYGKEKDKPRGNGAARVEEAVTTPLAYAVEVVDTHVAMYGDEEVVVVEAEFEMDDMAETEKGAMYFAEPPPPQSSQQGKVDELAPAQLSAQPPARRESATTSIDDLNGGGGAESGGADGRDGGADDGPGTVMP